MKTSRAVAYLKRFIPDNDPSPALDLSQSDSLVLKNLENGLLVTYVVDTGDEFHYIQHHDLANEHIDEGSLHTVALQNLMSLVENGNLRVVPTGDIFAVLFDGNLEASVILLDTLWNDSFRQFVTGEYLVAVPSRDVVAFCDRSSNLGREQLLEVIERVKDSSHALLSDLIIRKDDRWVAENKA